MQIPKYWSTATIKFPHRNKRGRRQQRTVRRFGWSNESLEDAKQMANERAAEARTQIAQGKSVNWTERQDSYAIDGLPIREEILADHNHSIITRNRYGAECLNVEDVMMIDVDNQPISRYGFQWMATLAVTIIAWGLIGVAWLSIGLLITNATITQKITIALFAMLLIGGLSIFIRDAIQRLVHRQKGGYVGIMRDNVERFITENPRAALNLYQTPAGFRLIMLHDTFRADDDFTVASFDYFQADENYRRLCRIQQCFRARLTAKPWNIDFPVMQPRDWTWPIEDNLMYIREEWVRGYQTKAPSFAACRFIGKFGSASTHGWVKPVVELHDEKTRCHSELPIA